MLLLSCFNEFFFMKIAFIFSCSGMFRHVPECYGMFHVPGFIDARDTDLLDYRLIQTRTRRAWKGFWLVGLFVCFSRFQELFLLELVSCWIDLPKGSFQ